MLTLEVVAEFSLCDAEQTCGHNLWQQSDIAPQKQTLKTTSYTNIFKKESHLATKRHFLQNSNFESNQKQTEGRIIFKYNIYFTPLGP